jgi:hypothetical protein
MAFAMIATATTAATTTTESTTAATTTWCTLTRFTDVDGASLDLATIERLDGLGGFGIGRHLDEGKPTWTASVAIEHDLDLFHVPSVLTKYIFQFWFRHVVRQIAYIKPRSHYFLLLRLTSLSLFLGRRRANRPGRTICPISCLIQFEAAPRQHAKGGRTTTKFHHTEPWVSGRNQAAHELSIEK